MDVSVAGNGSGEGGSRENFVPPHEIFHQGFQRVLGSERTLVKGPHHLFKVG